MFFWQTKIFWVTCRVTSGHDNTQHHERKKIRRLTKVVARPTQRMNFYTRISTNHKVKTKSSNIFGFFRTHHHFVSDYQSLFTFEYDTRKNKKIYEDERRQTITILRVSNSNMSMTILNFPNRGVHELCVMIREVLCLISVYRSSRHERDVDGDRSRSIVEESYWYQLRAWYRSWRSRLFSLYFLRFL